MAASDLPLPNLDDQEKLLKKIKILETKGEKKDQKIQILKQESEEKDKTIFQLKQEQKSLLQKYINLKDNRFKNDDQFFQSERGEERQLVADNIRDRLDGIVFNQETQIRHLSDRITSVHALEAPYLDVFRDVMDTVFKDRHENGNFELDDTLGLVGQNPLSKKCFDLLVELYNKNIEDPKAFLLKTSEVDEILSGNKDLTSLKLDVQNFQKILVPLQMKTWSNHWLLFEINVNNNKKCQKIKCYNTTRHSTFNLVKDEGAEYFDDMEIIASRLFPEKFPEKMDKTGNERLIYN
jgi:hypothetical protein